MNYDFSVKKLKTLLGSEASHFISIFKISKYSFLWILYGFEFKKKKTDLIFTDKRGKNALNSSVFICNGSFYTSFISLWLH